MLLAEVDDLRPVVALRLQVPVRVGAPGDDDGDERERQSVHQDRPEDGPGRHGSSAHADYQSPLAPDREAGERAPASVGALAMATTRSATLNRIAHTLATTPISSH